MIERHKTRAWIGLAAWLLLSVVTVIFSLRALKGESNPGQAANGSENIYILTGGFLLLAMAAFFWACFHLARAKGYPGVLSLLGLLGPPAQLAVVIGLLVMPDKTTKKWFLRRPGKSGRQISNAERLAHARRYAGVGNTIGLIGIFAGLLIVIFRTRLFENYKHVSMVGTAVFLCGYAGVIIGCWWWLRAKCLSEAVAFIGLVPLAVGCIPYLHEIYRSNQAILPIGMAFMPLIPLVVVMVLPDKSGWTAQKRWRAHRSASGQPSASRPSDSV